MAETTVVNFRTPQEFIDYYGDNLKSELNLYDIQINKLGFIGFLLNLLGHTSYDVKQYYDSLFKEAFIATSQDTENLYFHAATYGYLPTFATPAKAFGNIVFDFASLPRKQSNVVRREVILGTDLESITFDNDGYKFITNSKYKFVELGDDYFVTITSESGQVQQIPFATSEIAAPFQNFEQYTTDEFVVSLPVYDFGTYYPYIIEIEDGHIADINVSVKTKGTAVYEDYDVNYVKYFEESFSKTVFLRKLTSQKFVIEFGSGVRGAYVPAADVQVTVKKTRGVEGNITTGESIAPDGYITIIDYYDDGSNNSDSPTTLSADSLVQIDFNYSNDGVDPLSGDDLRNDVIAHIQSYDMLVDELDFYNIAMKYMSDFRFLFKKSNIQDNIFYLCRSIRDKYQNVIHTQNHTFRIVESDAVAINVTQLLGSIGTLEPVIYEYIIVPSDNFNTGVESAVESVDLTTAFAYDAETMDFDNTLDTATCTEALFNLLEIGYSLYSEGDSVAEVVRVIDKTEDNDVYTITFDKVYPGTTGNSAVYIASPSVTISWDEVTNAQKYIVYRKKSTDPTYTHYLETMDTSIDDTGEEFNLSEYPLDPTLIFFPTFTIEGKEMVSPFVYKKNTFMNWFDGHILYDGFSVYFSESTDYITNFDIPSLYFFIEYNYLTKKSTINLKSNQDISEYEFEISINEVSLYNQPLVNFDNTTFQYEHTNDHGIFWDTFQISLNAYRYITDEVSGLTSRKRVFSGISNNATQIYDISDELVVLNFDHIVYSSPGVIDYIDPYILNVPLLDREVYLGDPMYYLDKTKKYIYDADIKGKRMVSDNLQFRFLNTIKMPAFYAENFTLQAYNYDIILPLKLSINIITNQQLVINNKINLIEKKEELLILVADWLQKVHTGPDIKFYNSQVVDLIHTERDWIKSVEVTLYDYNDTLIDSGLETISDYEGLKKIKDQKIDIIKYSPSLFYWDVDNIEIVMNI